MAVYDLEEQDQLDDLRAWWQQWGNTITTVALIAALALAGYQGWRWWNGKQAEEASALYAGLSEGARTNDLQKAKDATAQLEDRYARTGYAPRAALLLAKLLFDSGDLAGARTQLLWIIDHGDESELKEVARYRLAQLLLNDKQYDEALKMLDAKHDEPFAGLYADLRGDALAAAGRTDDAKAAYQLALTKLDAKSPYKNYVQVKLEALGGTAAPAPGGVGSIVIPSAPAAAPAPPAAPAPAPAAAPAPAPAAAPAAAPQPAPKQ
jgi:predicted negative regulator of RcsB-dependent stress response